MGIDNHRLDHDYLFLKITDKNGNDVELVMKKHTGRGDHLYDTIGNLEDCGDSQQLHTHADDIIVVGRWWSRKRIGCINGEVGWVCRNNDFLTHRLGVLMFAPLNMAIDLAFEMIGDPFIDEQIKGLTNDEVTAFITGPPYPTVSQKLQRIFFGEVRDEEAPEETDADEGTDDEVDDPADNEGSSSNSYYDSSSSDYDTPSSYSSSPSSQSAGNRGGSNDSPAIPLLLFLVFAFLLLYGSTLYFNQSKKAEPSPDSNSGMGGGGILIPDDSFHRKFVGQEEPSDEADGLSHKTPPGEQLDANALDRFLLDTENPSKPPSNKEIDRQLIREEQLLHDSEKLLLEKELERRRLNPASPEQARRAEAAGRDNLGRSPFD